MANEEFKEEWGIDRRTVLKSAGAASGAALVGVSFSGVAAAQGDGKPCHKAFECEDEDATYVKIEFVIERDEDGNITDCYFEEETDTGLVWVESWESKEGEECDPISVTLSYADGFTAQKVMAFGGKDCDTETVDITEDRLDSYESGLETESGNTAAISNLQFCIVEAPIFGSGEVAFGYEDLPTSGSDWDVNDLVVDMNTSFEASGHSNGNPEVDQLTFDIIPQALGAGDDHEWRLEFTDDGICDGDYTLTYYDEYGTEQTGMNKSGDLPGVITVFEHTQDLFDESLANAELPGQEGDCKFPNYWAHLTITFDDGCPIDIPTAPGDLDVHASDLFFNPVLENLNPSRDVVVGRGDERLVAVPDTWEWPLGAVQIWDAYDEVTEGSNGLPVYATGWFDGDYDDENTTNCNFEPDDDNSIKSV